MINYTKKNINFISFIITLCLCIILFIILDMCFLKSMEIKNVQNTNYVSKIYQKYNNPNRRNNNKNVLELEDTVLQLMQIDDIYDENTKIEEVDNLQFENTSEKNQIDLTTKWRIEIPKINLNAPIKAGTSQDILAVAVGHFDESNKWEGNVALAGHNRGYNCNFFENIKYLEVGDKIIYYTENGKREYKVVVNRIIQQTDWSYIKNTNDNRITLITCVENMYEYRRCIQAVESS